MENAMRSLILARIAVTALACILAAAVALTAPPLWREALDLFFGWVLMMAGAIVAGVAAAQVAEEVTPPAARAIGRAAFRVARAAYKVARR